MWKSKIYPNGSLKIGPNKRPFYELLSNVPGLNVFPSIEYIWKISNSFSYKLDYSRTLERIKQIAISIVLLIVLIKNPNTANSCSFSVKLLSCLYTINL